MFGHPEPEHVRACRQSGDLGPTECVLNTVLVQVTCKSSTHLQAAAPPGRSPPVQYRRIYFGPALSRSASMSQSGSVCDLHSHMPAPQSARCCVVGQVTMELHGDSAAGGSDPGPLVLQRSPRLESRSAQFICRTSEFI